MLPPAFFSKKQDIICQLDDDKMTRDETAGMRYSKWYQRMQRKRRKVMMSTGEKMEEEDVVK